METKKIQKYKIERVEAIKEKLQKSSDVLLADYRGLNVAQVTELRTRLREKEASFTVVKNNLAQIAFKELNMPLIEEYFKGPTAMTLIKADAGPVAKVLVEFSKNAPLTFKGGVIGGKAFSAEQVSELSKLPGRDQLIAMLMGTMNAPLKNLMYAMNGVIQKLVRTLQAVADKKESE